MISVVIPVGPFPENKRWLDECMESVEQQTYKPVTIVLIDDGAALQVTPEKEWDGITHYRYGGVEGPWKDIFIAKYYKALWRLGISHAFNFGVMLAPTECVFMLGSDDTLEPTCLERCWESYNKRNKADGYYSVPIRYMDTQEIQTAPCNAAMVTKGFWRRTGGFPIESSVGVGDSMLLSICIAHKLPVYWVGHDVGDEDIPLYNYRRHPDIHTYKLGPWWGVIDQTRNIVTEQWNEDEVKAWTKGYVT